MHTHMHAHMQMFQVWPGYRGVNILTFTYMYTYAHIHTHANVTGVARLQRSKYTHIHIHVHICTHTHTCKCYRCGQATEEDAALLNTRVSVDLKKGFTNALSYKQVRCT